MNPCPCGRPLPYEACCGPLHDGRPAPSAEALMRSRYSAFAVGDTTYLLDSWDPDTRPRRLRLEPGRTWTGLQILSTGRGGMFDDEGTVAFRASYRDGAGPAARDGVQEEHSRFRRVDGQWRYVGALRPRD